MIATTLDPAGTGPTVGTSARRHATVPTALGEVTLVVEGDALVGLYYAEHRPEPDRAAFGRAVEPSEDGTLASAAQQVADYVAGSRTTFDLRLRAGGSECARQVWDLIAAVPRGQTTTYAALGRAVGVGPRAAGQFVARNPLCLVVPCHRVVASDGRLTGYAGGVDRKRRLLELEGAVPNYPGGTTTAQTAGTGPAGPGGPEGTEKNPGSGNPARPEASG